MEADGYFAFQHPLAVFGRQDEMVEKASLGVGTGPIFERHIDSMPRLRCIL